MTPTTSKPDSLEQTHPTWFKYLKKVRKPVEQKSPTTLCSGSSRKLPGGLVLHGDNSVTDNNGNIVE